MNKLNLLITIFLLMIVTEIFALTTCEPPCTPGCCDSCTYLACKTFGSKTIEINFLQFTVDPDYKALANDSTYCNIEGPNTSKLPGGGVSKIPEDVTYELFTCQTEIVSDSSCCPPPP